MSPIQIENKLEPKSLVQRVLGKKEERNGQVAEKVVHILYENMSKRGLGGQKREEYLAPIIKGFILGYDPSLTRIEFSNQASIPYIEKVYNRLTQARMNSPEITPEMMQEAKARVPCFNFSHL